MRKLMLLALVAVFALSAGAAWAAPSQPDGWAGEPLAGYGGQIGNPATNWVQAGGNFSNVVIWDHDDSQWMVVSGTFPIPDLSVTCDIELRVEETGQTDLYFHVGDTGQPVPAGFLNWNLSQNHPCWVGITKSTWTATDGPPDGVGANLFFDNDGPLGYGILGADVGDGKIPFDVYYSLDGGGDVLAAYTEGVGGWGYWSPDRVPACDHYGYWKFVLDVELHEADGRYLLDPVMVVVPGL